MIEQAKRSEERNGHINGPVADILSRRFGIELRHLRYFLLLAEELHFGRAAARAGIDQSPFSRSIVDLEERLGVRLFVRDRRHTEMTTAGSTFVVDVRRIFTDIAASIDRLRIVATGGGEPLRLGLCEGAAGPEFGRFMQLARKADPPVAILIVEKPAAKLFAMVARGGLDAAFTLWPPEDDAELDAEVVWSGPLNIVVARDHWAADRSEIALAELRGESWIMPNTDAVPGYARQIEALLQRHEIRPTMVNLASHQNSIVQLAAAGVGVGIIAAGITPWQDEGVTIKLSDNDAILHEWFVWPRERSPALATVRDLIATVAAEQLSHRRP